MIGTSNPATWRLLRSSDADNELWLVKSIRYRLIQDAWGSTHD